MFFFYNQKTAYEMRSSDWSSDVCSSDLPAGGSRLGNRCIRPSPVSHHGLDKGNFPSPSLSPRLRTGMAVPPDRRLIWLSEHLRRQGGGHGFGLGGGEVEAVGERLYALDLFGEGGLERQGRKGKRETHDCVLIDLECAVSGLGRCINLPSQVVG